MFARVFDVEPKHMLPHMLNRDKVYEAGVREIAKKMMRQYEEKKIVVPHPYVRKSMRDHSSGKLRDIATLAMLHQFWDYVAVEMLEGMMPIIGQYQCASLKGRGQGYGSRAIQRWVKGYAGRRFYAVKLDVRKCYDSIRKNNLIAFFFKRTRNKDLRWLLESIINLSPSPGLLIGSYFAQFACNMYMSQIYHFSGERIRYRGENPVDHVLGYMDDLLLLGRNKKALTEAARDTIAYAASLGLEVKNTWEPFEVTPEHPVDILGFTFYTDRTKIRERIFFRITRIARKVFAGCVMAAKQASRLTSYNGYMAVSNALRSCYGLFVRMFNTACNMVSCCA